MNVNNQLLPNYLCVQTGGPRDKSLRNPETADKTVQNLSTPIQIGDVAGFIATGPDNPPRPPRLRRRSVPCLLN